MLKKVMITDLARKGASLMQHIMMSANRPKPIISVKITKPGAGFMGQVFMGQTTGVVKKIASIKIKSERNGFGVMTAMKEKEPLKCT